MTPHRYIITDIVWNTDDKPESSAELPVRMVINIKEETLTAHDRSVLITEAANEALEKETGRCAENFAITPLDGDPEITN